MEYGYIGAIKAAGAIVHVAKYFGSYQGDIWTKVTYQDVTGWLNIAYGSCALCDAYEAFRDYDREPVTVEQLADFGRQYLDHIMSQDAAEVEASRNLDWDSEASVMLAFIRENA